MLRCEGGLWKRKQGTIWWTWFAVSRELQRRLDGTGAPADDGLKGYIREDLGLPGAWQAAMVERAKVDRAATAGIC